MHVASKIDSPVTIPNITSKNIISPSPRSPRSNFELYGRVIYNSHRKFDLESRRGPLGDILCIYPLIYLLIRDTRVCVYVRTPIVLITCISRAGLFSANWKVRLRAPIYSVPMLVRSRTERFILANERDAFCRCNF